MKVAAGRDEWCYNACGGCGGLMESFLPRPSIMHVWGRLDQYRSCAQGLSGWQSSRTPCVRTVAKMSYPHCTVRYRMQGPVGSARQHVPRRRVPPPRTCLDVSFVVANQRLAARQDALLSSNGRTCHQLKCPCCWAASHKMILAGIHVPKDMAVPMTCASLKIVVDASPTPLACFALHLPHVYCVLGRRLRVPWFTLSTSCFHGQLKGPTCT